MPWQEVVTVELRQQFVHDALRRMVPVAELCAAYGISRKTGYKFLARYDTLGVAGLADQSRRPHRSPAALDPVLLDRLLEAHHRHPYWGPRKLLRLVGDRWPDAPWPVRSTVARCFRHLGLVTARRRVRRPGPAGPPLAPMDAPNAVWTSDYKGQFKLRDGQYCFPLTVADGYSRMLLACQIAGARSTTPSGRTRRSTTRPRPRSTRHPRGPIPPASRRWSIPATTRSAG
jgi:putative transposase